MALNTDAHGFIIGDARLKQMADGIEATKDNTKTIVDILTQGLKTAIESEGEKTRNVIAKSAIDADRNNAKNKADTDPFNSGNQSFIRKTKTIDASDRDPNSARSRSAADRERGANGRFVGKDPETSSVLSKINQTLHEIRSIPGGGSGYDPSLDALGELKDLVSPVSSVFSKMSAKAIGLFRGRIRKRRGDEVLPEEQSKANRENQRNDKERNKLLRRLIDAVRGNKNNGVGGLGGLLGGLLGQLLRLGKGGGKYLLKRIPLLGLLLGGGMLASDWGGLDRKGKGKGVGEIAGGAAGAALGTLLGPVGTVAGGALGMYLGGIFGEKVGEWTEGLKREDFAKIFKKFLVDLAMGGLTLLTSPFSMAKSAAGTIASGTKKVASRLKDNVSQTAYDLTGGAIGSDVNSPIGKNISEKQMAIYNALRKQGLNKNQAIALTATVGRENNYQDEYLFGTHYDAANGKKNMGMLSWQKDRKDKLMKYLGKKGLLDKNGNMIRGQATLDAQAEFAKYEIDNDKNYSKVKKYLAENPNASLSDLSRVFGKGYVRWMIDGGVLKNGNIFDPIPHKKKEANYAANTKQLVDEQKKSANNIPKTIARPAQSSTSLVVPKGAAKTPAIKVPKMTSDLSKVGKKEVQTKNVVIPNQDSTIAQNISDRSLAHIITGGIGYQQNQG